MLSCTGNETRLLDCLISEDNVLFCSTGTAKSVVMCTGKAFTELREASKNPSVHTDTSCENDAVRLVGGHTVKEGRVQVCFNGEWHSVCGDKWSEVEAEVDVVCSVLGYSNESGQKNIVFLSFT